MAFVSVRIINNSGRGVVADHTAINLRLDKTGKVIMGRIGGVRCVTAGFKKGDRVDFQHDSESGRFAIAASAEGSLLNPQYKGKGKRPVLPPPETVSLCFQMSITPEAAKTIYGAAAAMGKSVRAQATDVEAVKALITFKTKLCA